jgi:hypothetical protein
LSESFAEAPESESWPSATVAEQHSARRNKVRTHTILRNPCSGVGNTDGGQNLRTRHLDKARDYSGLGSRCFSALKKASEKLNADSHRCQQNAGAERPLAREGGRCVLRSSENAHPERNKRSFDYASSHLRYEFAPLRMTPKGARPQPDQ